MVITEDSNQPAQSPHLFMVRMWPENLGDGLTDWRGKIQHVNSGEVRYFRDWLTLEAFIQRLLNKIESK